MKTYYLEIILITCFTYASSNRAKRFSDYEAHDTRDWNWISKDQVADAQTSQITWPRSGNTGSMKGKGDQNPNRDGAWTQDNWGSGVNKNDGSDMAWNTQPQGNSKGSTYPDEDQEGDLETILRGVPGMDFPNFVNLPDTDFDCSSMPSQGYYGDVDAGCQVFHICQPGNRKDSFLCPVGTIFNQKYFVCDWWFNVNCSDTPSYYELNNEVYKDPASVTEEVPVTTEKSMPWNSQDLDKKKPTKSWGNQPSTGKQNPNWKGTPARRGSKSSGPVSTSREMSNTWSRSDVQKEVTLSWGAASSSPSETYLSSSSAASNSITPTTKPIWYGIDGQPAKDQSSNMSKRVGLIQTRAPFGTRIRKTNGWTTTNPHESLTLPMQNSNYKTTSTNLGVKGIDTHILYSTSGNSHKIDDNTDAFKTENGITWDNDVDYDYFTTKSWLKGEDNPENSVNPTGVKGFPKQQTTKRIDPEISINPTGIKGVWEQQTSNGMDSETSINPPDVKGVWQQQTTKRMDSETSINPSKVKGVWDLQTTKTMDPETSINPPGIKGVWKQQTSKGMDSETSINPSGVKGVWKQQTSKGIDYKTSINPPGIKGVWKQQTSKVMDSETSINPTRMKGIWEQHTKTTDPETSINQAGIQGVWKQPITKRIHSETSINPTRMKGAWDQQTTRRMDPETSIIPTEIKGVWEQQTTGQSNKDPSLGANALKNEDFDKISHSRQNGRKFKTTSSQKKKWNQRRMFRDVQSSSSVNRGLAQNRISLENLNRNAINRRQNWK